MVAPFTGAWIEIPRTCRAYTATKVAPFTGAWTEMLACSQPWMSSGVAPFTGAWIEMPSLGYTKAMRMDALFVGV